MRLLSLSQKGAAKDSLVLTADETLKIAVENGCRAAGLDAKLGKIEKGRTADLILLDENAPNFQPHHHFPSALVYSSTGCEVTDVLIGGKVVMKDRSLTTIDEERMSYEIQKVIDTFG